VQVSSEVADRDEGVRVVVTETVPPSVVDTVEQRQRRSGLTAGL